MKVFLFFLLICSLSFYLEVQATRSVKKCVQDTNKVCTPFTYEGVSYDDCIATYWSNWCLVDGQTGSGNDYSSCGECTGIPEPTTTSFGYTSITDLQTPSNLQSDKPKKCVQDTNKVCTPFTYEGVSYDDCVQDYLYNWCLVDGQTGSGSDYSKCGECTGIPEPTTTPFKYITTPTTTKVSTKTSSNSMKFIPETNGTYPTKINVIDEGDVYGEAGIDDEDTTIYDKFDYSGDRISEGSGEEIDKNGPDFIPVHTNKRRHTVLFPVEGGRAEFKCFDEELSIAEYELAGWICNVMFGGKRIFKVTRKSKSKVVLEVINELPVAKNNIKVNSQGQLIIKNINRRAEGIWECSVQSWTVHHRDPRKTYTTVIEFKPSYNDERTSTRFNPFKTPDINTSFNGERTSTTVEPFTTPDINNYSTDNTDPESENLDYEFLYMSYRKVKGELPENIFTRKLLRKMLKNILFRRNSKN